MVAGKLGQLQGACTGAGQGASTMRSPLHTRCAFSKGARCPLLARPGSDKLPVAKGTAMAEPESWPPGDAKGGFAFPNWAVGLFIAAGLILIGALVYAVSIDVAPEARVQIIYQTAL